MRSLPSIYQFNKALGTTTKMGGLFKRSYTRGVATFSALINGLILEDKTPEAVELFKKLMRKREVEPNMVMYGTIINGLCKTGNTSTPIPLLRIMEEGSCRPDMVAYIAQSSTVFARTGWYMML